MNCNGCFEDVTDDGHGELIHVIERAGVTSYKYGCVPTARPGQDYPVAQ